MGLIKLLRDGCWSVRSASDPRWNGSGEGAVGGLVMPEEAKAHIRLRKAELGEEEPDDLKWSYHKY